MTLIKRSSGSFYYGDPKGRNTKGCSYYTAHNAARPNESQTPMLYLKTFQVGPEEETAREREKKKKQKSIDGSI